VNKTPDLEASKATKIRDFNPDNVGTFNGKLFGLPFDAAESEVIVLPVPWEATVSYRGGTSQGPAAILEASPQLDLYDPQLPEVWQTGISMLPISHEWMDANDLIRKKARVCIEILESGGDPSNESIRQLADTVNERCRALCNWVQQTATQWLEQNKLVCVLGGDHSSPLGLIRALAQRHESFGILQIDAHADLRQAYQTFEYSHASIMYRALESPQVSRLVQVGIRDYCSSEAELIRSQPERIRLFEDRTLQRRRMQGQSWVDVCSDIVAALPQQVYVSFDIDGLDPELCPHTGTPVPGGFHFEDVFFLIEAVVRSGREIIGFDLCEVSPGEDNYLDSWDAIVGARVLYRLANLAAVSQGRTPTPLQD